MTYDIFFTNEWWSIGKVPYDENIDPAFHQMQYMGYYDRKDPINNLFALQVALLAYFAALGLACLFLYPLKKFAEKNKILTQNVKKVLDVFIFDVIICITMACYLEMTVVGILVF